MSERTHQLQSVVIGDEADAWAEAGFEIVDGATRVGSTTLSFTPDHGPGIHRALVAGIAEPVDGMAFGPGPERHSSATAHPNRVTAFDHLVAMSPDMDRTTAALTEAGLEHRRTRTFEAGGGVRRQAFFWLGDVILELVGDDAVRGEGPAVLWGLALTCDDLDTAADHLGDALGSIKPAVQPGRRIATIRTKDLGISVPIALMSPHPRAES